MSLKRCMIVATSKNSSPVESLPEGVVKSMSRFMVRCPKTMYTVSQKLLTWIWKWIACMFWPSSPTIQIKNIFMIKNINFYGVKYSWNLKVKNQSTTKFSHSNIQFISWIQFYQLYGLFFFKLNKSQMNTLIN